MFFLVFNIFPFSHVKKLIVFVKNSVFEYSTPSKFVFLKTSISRNHACRVLRSRFFPFGFVLEPFRSIYMFLKELLWIRVKRHLSKHRFHEIMPIVFSIVDFPRIKARLLEKPCFTRFTAELHWILDLA